MLTSSDAKWRCLWHMLVWSINLSLVAQFLHISSHVAFYIIAAISILVLPALTAVYSNTSGRHGAGLLRAGLVVCDPVLACITVTPSLMLNQLPGLVDEYGCLRLYTSWNSTLECVLNHTDIQDKDWYVSHVGDSELTRQLLTISKKQRYMIIEGAIVTPILLALLMCKRTRKMNYNTFLISCGYWLVLAVEAVSLLENVLLEDVHKHIVYTTEAMISVVVILSASYAVITLLSYLSPVTPPGANVAESESEHDRFDFLYRAFVGTASVLFCEIPLIVARFRMLALDTKRRLPGTFYVWLIKDCVFGFMILVLVYGQRYGHRYLRLPCKSFDSESAFQFEPEKRDRYIHQHQKDTKTLAITKQRDDLIVPVKMDKASYSVAKETKDKEKQAEKDSKRQVTGILKTEKDALLVGKKGLVRLTARADHSTPKKGKPKEAILKKPDIAMQELSPIKAHHSPQKSPSDHKSTPKKASSIPWSSDSEDSDDYLELDARKQRKLRTVQEEDEDTISKSPPKNDTSSIPNETIKKPLQKSDKSPKHWMHLDKDGKGHGDGKHSGQKKTDHKDKDKDQAKSPALKEHKMRSPKSPKETMASGGNQEDEDVEIPKKKIKRSEEGSPQRQEEGDNESPKKDNRRVMFQFDIGEGKAIAIKSRSDSPGVIIDSPKDGNESDDEQ